jgi:Fe2+ transport system protein FeoA
MGKKTFYYFMDASRIKYIFRCLLRHNLNNKPQTVNIKEIPQTIGKQPLDLAQERCGVLLKIVSLRSASPVGQRLRELGFCEMAEVCKVSDNGALICNLLGCRVAIGRDLGSQILVERVCR